MKLLIVVDMQNGVFVTPRYDREGKTKLINQLISAAEQTIFIQHVEGEMSEGSKLWEILPELKQPNNSIYVNKTACDAFWNTELENTLKNLNVDNFVICGCATDYCVDTTIKVGASKNYAITVASDAHTTADRTYATAQQLIGQHNEVWSGLSIPGSEIKVKTTQNILFDWGM
ncbi:isochorismatase family protein [Pectobacterium sp. B2J-2]|uniref:isochorismatase family protein n=1 Tax=Pectobacterium sp. B2J-2 TaxID=3385372 RepID=UPI0038FCBE9A